MTAARVVSHAVRGCCWRVGEYAGRGARAPARPQVPTASDTQRTAAASPGFRWIAVRPGAAPPPGAWAPALTPGYRGGANRHVDPGSVPASAAGPSPAAVGMVAGKSHAVGEGLLVFNIAVVVFVVQYVLLVISKSIVELGGG